MSAIGSTEISNEILKSLLGLSLTNTNPYSITDTNLHENLNCIAIFAITEAVFDTGTSFVNVKGNSLEAETIPAGQIWYIKSDAIKLASGKIIAYQTSPAIA